MLLFSYRIGDFVVIEMLTESFIVTLNFVCEYILYFVSVLPIPYIPLASLVAYMAKSPCVMQETWV